MVSGAPPDIAITITTVIIYGTHILVSPPARCARYMVPLSQGSAPNISVLRLSCVKEKVLTADINVSTIVRNIMPDKMTAATAEYTSLSLESVNRSDSCDTE